MTRSGRSQAVIEFKLDGTILGANENFLGDDGLRRAEIVGRHHSMFARSGRTPKSGGIPDVLGPAQSRRIRRRQVPPARARADARSGFRPPTIRCSISTASVFKVVKFAADVTAVENERRRRRPSARRGRRAGSTSSPRSPSGLKQLSEGNLMTRLNAAFAGDYEQLRYDFNEATVKLQEAMKALVVNAGGIRPGADEISQAADDLSRRTEQQAASLEETAAALDEITATVRRPPRAPSRPATSSRRQGRRRRRGEVVRRRPSARWRQIEKSSQADQPDHRRHRRDRLPDQPAGAQRRRRGGARRRRRHAASRSSLARCARWPSARPRRPRRSRR